MILFSVIESSGALTPHSLSGVREPVGSESLGDRLVAFLSPVSLLDVVAAY